MPKSRKVETVNDLPSKTVQADAEFADIHNVLRKYPGIQIRDHLAHVDALYHDVSEFSDFAELKIQQKDAERRFMQLPSKVREVFHHDVMEWLDAAHNKTFTQEQADKLRRLGLLEESNVDLAQAKVEGTPQSPPSDTGPSA